MAAMTGGAEGPLPGPHQEVIDAVATAGEPPQDDDERIERAVALWRKLKWEALGWVIGEES